MSKIIPILVASILFAMPQLAAAYVIGPGDTLQVDVLEDPGLNRSVLVLPDGTVNFPGAGSIRVGGTSPIAAQEAIANRLTSQFASKPSVYVSVSGLSPESMQPPTATKDIYIMGEINKPGIVEAGQGITLLQAIAQAGGFSRFAATKRVELHRVDPNTGRERIYVYDYRNGKGISGATPLAQGDVIVIPERRLFE